MTNEEFVYEMLIEAEKLKIRKEVLDLSKKIREENSSIDINTSIENAYLLVTKKNTIKK